MVSGNDTTESEAIGQGTWSNPSPMNSASYQGSHTPQDLKNTAIAPSTETQFRTNPQGTMQNNTSEIRTTPRGTANNSAPASNSMTFEESNMSPLGSKLGP